MLISVNQLIRETWKLFLAHWKSFLPYTIVSALIGAGIGGLGILLVLPSAIFPFSGEIMIMVLAVIILLSIYVGAWFNAATLKAGLMVIQGGSVPPVGAALKESRPLIWRVIGAGLTVGVILLLPLAMVLSAYAVTRYVLNISGGSAVAGQIINIVLSLFGIASLMFMFYYGVRLAFTLFAIVYENKTIGDSIRMSKALVSGRWGAVLWRLLAPGTVFWLLLSALQLIVQGIEYITGQNPVMAIASVIARLALQVILTPLFFIPGILLYQSATQTSSASTPTSPPPLAAV